ncbi:DNA polymerase III subunit gamma/tau, partial [Janthinobacterium sp. hw3]|nr:DNA polymerase III subunit gamma/tau [Janthinobacterium fluminis]
RAASKMSAGGRPASAAPAAASAAAPAPAPAASAPPVAAAPPFAAAPQPTPAPVRPAAPLAPAPKAPAPWEDAPAAAVTAGATAVLEAPPRPLVQQQAEPDDDLPPWVTEFSDDSASAAVQAAPAEAAAPAARPVPQVQRPPYVVVPVPGLDWDGNWPAVAAVLPLRGVAQQLAVQAELIECQHDGHSTLFRLRVPIDTWRSPANVEKLAAALSERFQRKVGVDTELGPVWYTASAEAQAHREACQRQAEDTIEHDPFVQSMMRDFNAIVVPGSITPAPAPSLH